MFYYIFTQYQREGIMIQSTIVSVPSSELAPLTPFPKTSVGSLHIWILGGDTLAYGRGGGGGANSDDRSVDSVRTV